jgi:hypothetical protein
MSIINATNEQDGQKMVYYEGMKRDGSGIGKFVREHKEFKKKFVRYFGDKKMGEIEHKSLSDVKLSFGESAIGFIFDAFKWKVNNHGYVTDENDELMFDYNHAPFKVKDFRGIYKGHVITYSSQIFLIDSEPK